MNRLKYLRTLKGLTFKELENATGIADSTLCSIESGQRRMNVTAAAKLADYFGVSVDFILGRTVTVLMDEFMSNLLKVYSPYEGLPNEDYRTSTLAFIMKSIYEMNDASLEQVRDYVAFVNAKSDFKEDK